MGSSIRAPRWEDTGALQHLRSASADWPVPLPAGSLTLVSYGRLGETLQAQFKGLTLTLQRSNEGVGASMTYILNELSGTEASRLFKLIRSVAAGGRWRLERDGESIITLAGSQPVSNTSEMVPAAWNDLACDLAAIERKLDISFKMPFDISALERINVKVARMLLEGRVTCLPTIDKFTGVATGEIQEHEIEEMMQPRPVVRHGLLILTVLGRRLRLGQLCAYHPCVRLVDGEDLRNALVEGTAKGRRVVLEPQDSTPIRIWLDGKLGPEARIVPERWNIPELMS